MPNPDNKVRVFISSTFRDMHAERDHLVTVVFPELRERCERLGLEFFDVDLRWGVPEKTVDGETANSWEYCRQWIDRVEPFFVCMLGQRYGWEPEPHQLKDADDRARQLEQKRSITDMEVRYAVLNTKLKRHSYFYVRDTEAPSNATDFVDPPPLLAKLDELKTEVRACGRPVRDYPCKWKDNAFTEMEAFGNAVLADLWSGVLRDERYVSKDVWRQVLGRDPDADPHYTDETAPVPDRIAEQIIPLAKPPPKNPLAAEREQMAAFAASRLRWFQGRTKELKQLTDFIQSTDETAPRLAVIAAVPGQGKSALMAKLSETLRHSSFDIRHFFTVSHFVGATEQSSTAYALVKRLNDELDASDIPFPEGPTPEGQSKEELKLDFNSLCLRLSELLGDYAGERRIVLLLDALNQLTDGHELGWLPYRLGPSVRIIVSCIDDPTSKEDGTERKVLTALTARHLQPLHVPLGALTEADVRLIAREYFAEYCKELDPPHVDAICDERKLLQARNPLYLLVMLAELRMLGGNDINQLVPELIANMAIKHPTTVTLFKWVLQRMEQAEGFGAAATGWWCLYLASGRVGMASRELADLLARKFHSEEAALTAQRIERGLRRYLQRRGETLDFFHGQLRQAVFESYGHEDSNREAHQDMADYFRALVDPAENQSWTGTSLRPFNEIAFHLTGAQQWDDLCAYLTDFRCLDVRVRAGQVFAVVTDQQAANAALPELAEEAKREQERVEVCAQYSKALIAYARDCAAAKDPPLPPPPATVETAGRATIAEGHSPRSIRLRAISNFTASHASLIAARPVDFLSFATNHAEYGPLTEAAALITARGQPWMARLNRSPAPALMPQCLQILQGHTGMVKSVSVTPDGRRAVSGGEDRTVRVWDLDSGECLRILQGHADKVTCLSIAPDGRRAVSGAGWTDKSLRVWDLESGECLQTLHGHRGSVTGVSVTPDCRRAISSSHNTLQVWDLESGRCLHTLEGHLPTIECVSMTPDGRRAVSGSQDCTLRVWDLDSGQCLHTLEGHEYWVTSVSVTPDGRRAVSGSENHAGRVWDLDSGQCLHTLLGSFASVVSVTPDGRRAVVGDNSWGLTVWNLDTGQRLHTIEQHALWKTIWLFITKRRIITTYQKPCIFHGHAGPIFSVNVTADGRRAVSASGDQTVRIWNLESDQNSRTPQRHRLSRLSFVSISPDGRRAVSCSDDFRRPLTLRAWDIDSGRCLQTVQGHTAEVVSVCVFPDCTHALSGNHDGTIRLWNLNTGQCLKVLTGHAAGVTNLSVTPDGKRAVSGSSEKTLRVWDLNSGQCLCTLKGQAESITSVSITPDGKRAVSDTGNVNDPGSRILRVWDIDSGKCLRILKQHFSHSDASMSVTSDGRRAVSNHGWDLNVWNLDSGGRIHILRGHSSKVNGVSVTPDGRLAISCSKDNNLRVWDLNSGQCHHTLQGHAGSVICVNVLHDGQRVVSGSLDQTLRVWDINSGQCLTTYYAAAAIKSVSLSASGDRIVCGTVDGQMHFLAMRNFPK